MLSSRLLVEHEYLTMTFDDGNGRIVSITSEKFIHELSEQEKGPRNLFWAILTFSSFAKACQLSKAALKMLRMESSEATPAPKTYAVVGITKESEKCVT